MSQEKAHPFFIEAVKPMSMSLRIFPTAGILALNISPLGVLECRRSLQGRIVAADLSYSHGGKEIENWVEYQYVSFKVHLVENGVAYSAGTAASRIMRQSNLQAL